MTNLLTFPSLLSPSLQTAPAHPCEPLELDCDRVQSTRLRLVSRAWTATTGLFRSIRYQPSLSQQTIAATQVNDLLRRH